MRLIAALLFCFALPLAAAVPAAAPAPAPAPAAPTVFIAGSGSLLEFHSSYDEETFSGRFERFTARIAFDPVSASGHFDVSIELASAGTENDERDEVLRGAEFFNALALPQARYQATRFARLADGRFVAEGTLSLREVSRVVPLTFTWTPGPTPRLEGSATVPRLAFQVGTGDWADTAMMPDAVEVRTRLLLQPAP